MTHWNWGGIAFVLGMFAFVALSMWTTEKVRRWAEKPPAELIDVDRLPVRAPDLVSYRLKFGVSVPSGGMRIVRPKRVVIPVGPYDLSDAEMEFVLAQPTRRG